MERRDPEAESPGPSRHSRRPERRQRRAQLIEEELERLAVSSSSSRAFPEPEARAPRGLRGRVRRLIAGELEALLAAGKLVTAPPGSSGQAATPALSIRAKSAPRLELADPDTVRKMQYRRKSGGGFLADAPPFEIDTSTAPLLPSRQRQLSQNIWAQLAPLYEEHPRISEAKASHVDFVDRDPPVKAFANPRDDLVRYREEICKPGNQLVMRK
mmetsp:Transcript_60639/g.131430  ORF Transcript_60639/g.131430 Transcript_60639/m.131430 type:complete len:214 (-) Transcript_60639:66-707(-)